MTKLIFTDSHEEVKPAVKEKVAPALIFLPSPLISSHHRQACKRKIGRWADIYDDHDCGFGYGSMTIVDFVLSLENKAVHDMGQWLARCLSGSWEDAVSHYIDQYGAEYRKILPDFDSVQSFTIPAWLHLEIKENQDYIDSLY